MSATAQEPIWPEFSSTLDRDVLVFVRQFRPPVMLSALFNSMDTTLENFKEKASQLNPNLGYTLELCAGIIDKQGNGAKEGTRRILKVHVCQIRTQSSRNCPRRSYRRDRIFASTRVNGNIFLLLPICNLYQYPHCRSLKLITTFRTGVGTSGSLQHLYYCQVE